MHLPIVANALIPQSALCLICFGISRLALGMLGVLVGPCNKLPLAHVAYTQGEDVTC
jgi:hypothetical protein